MNLTPDPACSKWKLWLGDEIEGTVERGVKTLFIRELPPKLQPTDDLSILKSKATRVWFCKEFTNWPLMFAIAELFGYENCCIEVEPKHLAAVPLKIRQGMRIYLKVTLFYQLKPGDQICVGKRFADEAFEVGKGHKVSPEQYAADVRIL